MGQLQKYKVKLYKKRVLKRMQQNLKAIYANTFIVIWPKQYVICHQNLQIIKQVPIFNKTQTLWKVKI